MRKHRAITRGLILLFIIGLSMALVAPLAAQQPLPAATTRPAAAGDLNWAKEPPQEFVLEIDGKSIEAVANQPFGVAVADKTLPVRIIPKPDRRFTTGEISFRYPSDFAFKYDPTGEAPSWELDGTDTVITVLRYDPESKSDELVKTIAEGMIEDAGETGKMKPVSIRFDGRNVRGRRVFSTLAGSRFQHDVFGFKAGGQTYVLMIQDTLSEAGTASAETVEAVRLLRETFQFEPKSTTAPAAAP